MTFLTTVYGARRRLQLRSQPRLPERTRIESHWHSRNEMTPSAPLAAIPYALSLSDIRFYGFRQSAFGTEPRLRPNSWAPRDWVARPTKPSSPFDPLTAFWEGCVHPSQDFLDPSACCPA